MSDLGLTIHSITARAVNPPLARNLRTAVTTIPSAPLVLIDLLTHEGVTGRVYIFAYHSAALAPLTQLVQTIGDDLKGKAVVPAERMRELDLRFRLLGWHGLVGMAIAGLDMVFWDALARAADVPLVRLLGGEPRPLTAYDSYGVVDRPADEKALEQSLASGFSAIKIRLGYGDLAEDITEVKWVREIIGPSVKLMVDYNQSLDPVEARHRIAAIAKYDIAWVEEPLHAKDLAGNAQVRATSPVPIQLGENWWFPRDMASAIAAGACDFAMPDVGKVGGVSGWLQAAALAEAASLPMSSHLFNEINAHLLPITPTAHYLEYLDTAGAVLKEKLRVVNGKVTAFGPGFGLEWDEAAVAKYKC